MVSCGCAASNGVKRRYDGAGPSRRPRLRRRRAPVAMDTTGVRRIPRGGGVGGRRRQGTPSGSSCSGVCPPLRPSLPRPSRPQKTPVGNHSRPRQASKVVNRTVGAAGAGGWAEAEGLVFAPSATWVKVLCDVVCHAVTDRREVTLPCLQTWYRVLIWVQILLRFLVFSPMLHASVKNVWRYRKTELLCIYTLFNSFLIYVWKYRGT